MEGATCFVEQLGKENVASWLASVDILDFPDGFEQAATACDFWRAASLRAVTFVRNPFLRIPRALKLVAMTFGLMLVLTACGPGSGAPEAYEQSVQEYFIAGCEASLEDEQYEQELAVCQCSYERMTTQIPFEDFDGLNNRLRDDPSILRNPEQDSVAPIAVQIISDCIDSVPLQVNP